MPKYQTKSIKVGGSQNVIFYHLKTLFEGNLCQKQWAYLIMQTVKGQSFLRLWQEVSQLQTCRTSTQSFVILGSLLQNCWTLCVLVITPAEFQDKMLKSDVVLIFIAISVALCGVPTHPHVSSGPRCPPSPDVHFLNILPLFNPPSPPFSEHLTLLSIL